MPAKPARLVAVALALTLCAPLTALASAHLNCASQRHTCGGDRAAVSCCCHSITGDAAAINAVVQLPQALPSSQMLVLICGRHAGALIAMGDRRLFKSPPDIARRDLPTLLSVLLL